MGDAIFYSASTGGFYAREIHGDTMPADAIRIPRARHRQLLEGQAGGREIIARDSKPILKPARKPSLAELRDRAIRRTRTEARGRILAVASLERQSNDNALLALAAIEGSLSDPEAIAAHVRRRGIDAIRAASNVMEARIGKMPAANLLEFDPAAQSDWPKED